MSRALVRTLLPLDRWREYFGVNPLHFHQMYSAQFASDDCGSVWLQYAWQHSNQVGRHELAQAIHDAEVAIIDQVRYSILPDWTEREKVIVPRPARREMYFGGMGNIRGQARSLELNLGYFIEPGVRVKQTLVSGAAIARADNDGDGYKEDCTVTIATDVTDPCEIRVYFPGEDGADEWEIRPVKVEIAGGLASIYFKSWLILDPDKEEAMNAAEVDGDIETNYIATADVYRVYTDASNQATLIWEGTPLDCCGTCAACTVGTHSACVTIRDEELGYVSVIPATYADGAWTAVALAACRAPDRVQVNYLSGWRAPHVACPMTEMDRYWLEAVARYAATLLDRKVCSCNNVEAFIDELRRDIAAVRQGIVFQSSTDSQISNPFGTWVGAIFAWNRVNAKGRALPK